VVSELKRRLPNAVVVELTGACVGANPFQGPPSVAENMPKKKFPNFGDLPRFYRSRNRAPDVHSHPGGASYATLYNDIVFGVGGLPDVTRFVYLPVNANMSEGLLSELYDLSSVLLLLDLFADVRGHLATVAREEARRRAEAERRARMEACAPPPRPLNDRRPIRQV
jgi:hypothetical protein